MNIALPDELEAFVHAQVQAGAYATPDAVVREALLRLRDDDSVGLDLDEDSQELAGLLREGGKGPFTPLTDADFENVRRRVLARHPAA